jgi:hypothetical protein
MDIIEPVHYELEKLGIKHICHNREANSISMFDLGQASTVCTECRIWRGEITIADIVMGRVDPLSQKEACDKEYRREVEEHRLRDEGKLLKHVLETCFQTHKDGVKLEKSTPYIRYTCRVERGSAGVETDHLCTFCKGSIDE